MTTNDRLGDVVTAGEALVRAANVYMRHRHNADVETMGINAGGYTITLIKGESWKDEDYDDD